MKMHKKTSFYICLILGAFMFLSGILDLFYGSLYAYEHAGPTIALGAVLLVAAFLLWQRNKREKEAYEEARAQRKAEELEKEAKVADIRAKVQAEHEAAKQRQVEWERTHGRIVTKVAGVTFDNDDGSSRQRILKAAMAEEACGKIDLQIYDHRGADAIAVFYDDEQIGTIPKYKVAEVKAVFDRVSAARLEVSRFRPEDDEANDDRPSSSDEYIYRADLTIVYTKDEADAT